ncbi:MAG: formate dehydrogenase subunit gamma, partial [Pseudomonadota bacterium]
MIRALFAMMLLSLFAITAQAQEAPIPDRSETGGAQTLEDIMARQQQLQIDDSFRSEALGNPDAAAALTDDLGARGGLSDSELWRGLRYDAADVTTQARGDAPAVLIQDSGMWWYEFRQGPLMTFGTYILLGTLGLLALFFVLRGRIRIDGEKTGRTITRFKAIERFGHWLMAGSFILLG